MTVPTVERVRPATTDLLARALREADEAGLAVVPWGAGSQQYVGNPPRRVDLFLLTTAIAGIVDHTPADLTVTAGAGTRLADLQATLAAHGQRLPLDPPHADVATLGGLIATNRSGPRRNRHGTLRDLLIGARTALVDGTVVRSGGRVVKNVTGYDLNKLLIGSLGTLGVVVEATFKVLPLPAREEAITANFPSLREAFDAGVRLARTALRLTAIEVHDLAGAPTLLVAAEGDVAPVRRALDDAWRVALECGARDLERWEEAEPLLARTRGLPERASGGVLLRASVPLAAQATYVQELTFVADRDRCTAVTSSHAGVGVVRTYLVGEPSALAGVASEGVRTAARFGGEAWIDRLASSLDPLDVWGDDPPTAPLMRRLKEEFDPKGTLNPGRFVGGI